jgi:hypothetical protein
VLLPSAQTNNLSPAASKAKWSIRPSTPPNAIVCASFSGTVLCAEILATPTQNSVAATQAVFQVKDALNFVTAN